MREVTAPPLPSLYDALVDELAEDTDPSVNFTELLALPARPPAPRRLRTHHEYQTARFREWWHRRERGLELTLDVGAWVPDRLLDDDDTVVVDAGDP